MLSDGLESIAVRSSVCSRDLEALLMMNRQNSRTRYGTSPVAGIGLRIGQGLNACCLRKTTSDPASAEAILLLRMLLPATIAHCAQAKRLPSRPLARTAAARLGRLTADRGRCLSARAYERLPAPMPSLEPAARASCGLRSERLLTALASRVPASVSSR